jgi:uncharacterized membrane protein YhaH (DUF805 family)
MIARYASFEGRVGCGEFWLFKLVLLLTVVAALIVSNPLGTAGAIFMTAFVAAALWLNIAMTVKRLHDIGWSGWSVLLGFLPLGSLFVLVLLVLPSSDGPNAYGPHPNNRPGHPAVAAQFA